MEIENCGDITVLPQGTTWSHVKVHYNEYVPRHT